jgi:hypothetical protein
VNKFCLWLFRKNPLDRKSQNFTRKFQRRRRDIFVETKIKIFLAPSGAAYSGKDDFQMPLLRSFIFSDNNSTNMPRLRR